MANLTLRNLVKVYGSQFAVKGINLSVPDKSFVALVGPSGCGKSTTLRMIAGLEQISHGDILIGDKNVNNLPSRKRGVSLVFQSYALYPHMTVKNNLSFGLRINGFSKEEIKKRVSFAAEILELEPYLDRKPANLSGGQKQRVAMGRAIVREPKIFLFDEPLSNLDAKLRNQMRAEIKKLHQNLKNTIVYVTHDQVEAMTMADIIVIMNEGIIEQVGSPIEVFNTPSNKFVASFIGTPQMNFFNAKLINGTIKINGIESPIIPTKEKFDFPQESGDIILGLRPEDIIPIDHGVEPKNKITINGTVTMFESLGNETIIFSDNKGKSFTSRMQQPRSLQIGENLKFNIDLDKIHLFDNDKEYSLLKKKMLQSTSYTKEVING